MPDEKHAKEEQSTINEPPIVAERSQMPSPPRAGNEKLGAANQSSRSRVRFLSAALLVIVSAGAGFGGGWLGTRQDNNTTIEQQRVVLNSQGELISSIAKEVGPSVVSVTVTSQSQVSNDFFGFQSPNEEQQSAGTGIIIDKSGLIITNRHVIPAGATRVGVTLSDGTIYEDVEVVGRTSNSDPLDIAFLKITDTKGKTLTPAKLGDSSKVGVGDSVVAIGNALGQFQNTVTSGIISGHGRNIEAGGASDGDTEELQNLFQTDTAINQGNSGGPLMNLSGEVIGINTAVAGGSAQNIGFAIPINDVKGVIDSVMRTGKLERPYLGLVFISITADMAKRYELDAEQGAYIPPAVMVGRQSVVKDGPADKAGVKEGDIITKLDDQKLSDKNTLTSALGKHKVGDTVTLTLVRDGKEMTLKVRLEAVPEASVQPQ